jgi:hypothetical protein
MRILLDNCTPRGIARELLYAAEAAGFEVFLAADQSIRYQQNLGRRKIAIVVLGSGIWEFLQPHWIESGKRSKALSPEA